MILIILHIITSG